MLDSLPFDALEADFQRYYCMDLREALWGENPMGLRRFTALVKWLPADAAIRRATNPSWNWTQETEFLATLLEQIDAGNRMFFEANKKDGASSPKPIKVPRPDDPIVRPRRRAKAGDIALTFGIDAIKKDKVT